MNIREEAEIFEKKADELSKINPSKARYYYLEAAERYIEISKISYGNEAVFIEKAESCYEKAKNLNETGEEPKMIESMKIQKPKINFKNIAGMQSLKEEIRMKIIEPLLHPELYEYFDQKTGGGILMYGPPGCGKSFIAEATAGEAGVTFFHVKASDLKSKWLGESEKNIASLFEAARPNQPCIIFFDEFEALGGERTRTDEHTRNLVSQLLTEMDGVGNKDKQILLLAATNEPWSIDVALRREGRFGTSIFIPQPDLNTRKEILKLMLEKKPLDKSVSIENLALITEHYSGADLKALVNKATENVLRECIKTNKKRNITNSDFKEALLKITPTTYLWYKHAIDSIRKTGTEHFFRDIIEAGYRTVPALVAQVV